MDIFKDTRPQLVAVLSGAIGAISDGMQYGWSAPFIPILLSENSPINITKSDESWLEQIYLIGGIAGLPVAIYCTDRIGRKNSIMLAAFSSLLAWVLMAFANHVAYLYVARFITGLFGDVAFIAAPMYVAEIADKKIRGFLAGIIYIMMLIGILLVYAIGPYSSFYVTSLVGAGVNLFLLIIFPFAPDSPYYLLSRGKYDKAMKNLERLRTNGDIENEILEIATAVKRQRNERGRPQDLIISKGNRKALIIMTVLNIAQHFSGISVILMCLHKILNEAGSQFVSSEVAGVMFSAFMLVAAIFADFFIDKFGRKGLLITSSLLSGVCILTLAIFFTFKNNGYDMSSVSWMPVTSVMIYAGTFKFGLGLIPIVMTSELFPAKVKAMGMSFADFIYVLFALASIAVYEQLADWFYYDIPFYLFAICTLFTALFAWLYIPETKGKTLEEIQFILKGKPIPVNMELQKIKNEEEEKTNVNEDIQNQLPLFNKA